MSTFTAVDLSRLPAPAIVELLDFEAIFAAMLADLRAREPAFTALTESDPAYKLLQVCAYRELLLRQRVNEAARAVMLAYAIGSDLDHLGALLGVARLEVDPGDPLNSIPPTMESDTEFRRRIQLAPEGYSVAGPEGAYIFHALSADPDVLDASATSPTPGEVVVTVLSRDGDGTPSGPLVAKVAAALTDDSVRPLTDHVTVQGATIVPYAVQATVYTYAGPDSTLVLAESLKRLDAYIEASHRLGRDVPLSGIFSVLHSEGVQRVELHSPLADIVISRTQASHCTAISITPGGVDE
ncbi:MAG TPA: baseplate J/gp47 family protein [Lysobacter sp.]